MWLLSIGSPFLVAAVTAVAGHMQGLPIAYVIAATMIALAMTATFLLRFEDWRIRRTPANKVAFQQAVLAFSYKKDQAGKAIAVTAGQPVFTLINSANFSLAYVVDT